MIKSLEKAMILLQEITKEPQSLRTLSETLQVHKSTVLRLLQTLEEFGMVERDEELRYRLGSAFYAMAYQALEGLDLRKVAAPVLRDLNARTNLTVHLAVLQGDKVVYIDKYEGMQQVQMYSRIGLPVPMSSAGVAKAILAHVPEPVRDAVLRRIEFNGVTETSIRSVQRYVEVLEEVRRNGYAVDRGELEPFIHCVAMPILSMDGAPVGAVSITATTSSHTFEQLTALLPDLAQATRTISRTLGGEA
ncbi:IclR family transcriptional regulator [Saccharothrix obliqua]|uniref:IclR family transcriptional regulator n=1 Tax=Saccharothrix obliqua TaxID=2861747 RepID=UPI001C60129F|nr:IclR family transcriptional regulator [Saccharothrix obliqua]MBW4721374.1 IclR family transcriptional regulator [Saccharothrix obliqua]